MRIIKIIKFEDGDPIPYGYCNFGWTVQEGDRFETGLDTVEMQFTVNTMTNPFIDGKPWLDGMKTLQQHVVKAHKGDYQAYVDRLPFFRRVGLINE